MVSHWTCDWEVTG